MSHFKKWSSFLILSSLYLFSFFLFLTPFFLFLTLAFCFPNFLSASSPTHLHRKTNFSSTNFKRSFRLLLWKNGRKELEKNKIEVQKRVSERNRVKKCTHSNGGQRWVEEERMEERARKRRGLVQIRSCNNSIHSSSIFLSFQTRCNSTILCNEQSSFLSLSLSTSFSVFLSLTLSFYLFLCLPFSHSLFLPLSLSSFLSLSMISSHFYKLSIFFVSLHFKWFSGYTHHQWNY